MRRWTRAFWSRPVALAGIVVIGLLIVSAIFGPVIVPEHLADFNPGSRLEPPSWAHPMGTDTAGRDVFARIVFGSRISLTVAVMVIVLAGLAGGSVGLVSGFLGGRVDDLVMRTADVFLSVPYLILGMAVAAMLGPGLYTAMMGLAIAWWPIYARLARAETLAIRQSLYVEAAVALGLSKPRIIVRHVLPNCLAPLLVKASLDFGEAILYSSALSFIGVGAQPPSPEWGALISVGRNYIREAWWFAFFPGLAIFVTVMAFNLLGDAIRDLIDPRVGASA